MTQRRGENGRVVLIIQARMGSTRLPGKSMLDLAGAPLVGRILERLKRCNTPNSIVLATSDNPRDTVLAELAETYGVIAFRGSEDDVLDRYYQAARLENADVVIRFPADNPIPEPEEIDRIVRYHLTGSSDFSTNLAQVLGNGYPDGIGAEVFDFDTLEQVWQGAADAEKREHPHLNFFDYATQCQTAPDHFTVGTVECPPAFRRPDLVLDVNTAEGYVFMRALYEALYPQDPEFHITDVIDWYDTAYRSGHRKVS